LKFEVGSLTLQVDDREMEGYLSSLFGGSARIKSFSKIGEGFHNAGFLLVFRIGDVEKHVVLRVVRGDTGWGHDYLGDRASLLILQHRLFNIAPRGTSSRSIDVACVRKDGSLVSLGNALEFFSLVEELRDADGKPYSEDLFNIARRGELTDMDRERCAAVVDYLVNLHSEKIRNDVLYKRHIRDLIGHGEMLMGVVDTYPDPETLGFTSRWEMAEIEQKAVVWRNRIKYLGHRLSRIHGDYHPFGNIRFREDNTLVATDQAREEWGEPADDVAGLTINYIFFSIWHYGEFRQPFQELYETFMDRYVDRTGDKELFKVIAPFYAFRGLVVIHPLYYPEMEADKRRKILNFIHNVLEREQFNPRDVKSYLVRR